jgi:IS30 family transposase
MAYYKKEEQMDLSDRIAIETGISNKDSFKKIGKLLLRHPSTIAHEVKENRTFIPGNYFLGKDCRFVRQHIHHHVCGDESCEKNCCRWRMILDVRSLNKNRVSSDLQTPLLCLRLIIIM